MRRLLGRLPEMAEDERSPALRPALPGRAIASAEVWENLVAQSVRDAPRSVPDGQAMLAQTLAAVKWGWSVAGPSLFVVRLAALAWHGLGPDDTTPPARRPGT